MSTMNLREVVGRLVDADVETGATTPVVIQFEGESILYAITSIDVVDGEYEDGNAVDTGPSVLIKAEEI